VLEVLFILLELLSPSRRIFIGSHSLPHSGSPYRSFKWYQSRLWVLIDSNQSKIQGWCTKNGVRFLYTSMVKDRYGELERGSEWEPIKILLEGDGDSNKTNTASKTRLRLTTQVGQAHVAIEVLLDLETNKQPSKSKHTNTHIRNLHGLLAVLHRSDRWPAPVRPVTPVRPVDSAGQAGGYSSRTTSIQRASVTSLGPGTKTPPKHNLHEWKTYTKPNKTTPNRPRTEQQHQDPKTHESSSSPEANPRSGSH
jgi:hypothetical protein